MKARLSFVLVLLVPMLLPLRCALFDLILAGDVIIEKDLSYWPDSEHDRHQADLFQPTNGAGHLALFVHGGFWKNQDRRYYRPITGLYSNVGLTLARRGIETAVVSYRLSPEVTINEQLQDIRQSIQWFASRSGHNEGREIFLIGHSAGAHLAMLAALDPGQDNIKAVIALSPILDIADMARHSEEDFNQELTGPFFGDAQGWPGYSPIHLYENSKPRTLILYGSEDYNYIQNQCERMKTRFGDTENIEVRKIESFSHSDMVLSIGGRHDPVIDEILRFVEQNP